MHRIKISYMLIIIVIIYAALFLIIPHTENLPADGGVKIQQVKDFIQKDYRSFAAVYNASKIDPDKKFFPIKPLQAYHVGDEVYYVHPFYVTLLFTPAYLAGGIYGIILLCMIFGLLTIMVTMKTADLIGIDEHLKKWLLIFLAFATIIPIYSFFLGEYTLSFFLVIFSVYLLLLGKEKKRVILYFLAGLTAGVSVFFRIELGLYCVLLAAGVFVFKIYNNRTRDILALIFPMALCAVVLAFCNYYVTGNIFGLRGVYFLEQSGGTFTLYERLVRLFNAFFISSYGIGLFLAWPIYFLLFLLFKKEIWNEVNQSYIKFILFIISIFIFSIPFFVYTLDGSILGPRYVATMQPLLALITFKVLGSKAMRTRVKQIARAVLVVYSVIVIVVAFIILVRFNQISDDVNINVSGYVKNDIVVLYDGRLYYSVWPLFKDKMIVLIDPKEDWDIIIKRTRELGIHDYTVIDFAQNKNTIEYPFKHTQYDMIDRHFYHGNYMNTIIENIRIK